MLVGELQDAIGNVCSSLSTLVSFFFPFRFLFPRARGRADPQRRRRAPVRSCGWASQVQPQIAINYIVKTDMVVMESAAGQEKKVGLCE